MNKKILMIYPQIPPTFWNFDHMIHLINYKAVFPPLGLMTVAAMLPPDYEIKLIDMNATGLEDSDILWADMVMISAMIIQKDSLADVVKRCNVLKRPVTAGGPYVTALNGDIDGIDHFVLNEAEITLPYYISDFEKGTLKKIYADATKPELSLTPPPRYDLIDKKDYPTMLLQYSRGCPFNCEFCDIIEMLGRRPRLKSPEQFIREMELLYDSGFRGQLFIVDDNFIGNRKKTKILLRSMIEWQAAHSYPFQLFTESSIDMAADDELIDLMVEAGFLYVFIGIETPDNDTLISINKNQNVDIDIFASIRKIQNKGIEVMGGFVVGFDHDPENIFELQREFIARAGIPSAMIGLLDAFPNTQLYRRLEKEGRLKKISSGNNMDFELNFISIMPEKKLIEEYKKLLVKLYDPVNFFKRCETFIMELPKVNLFYNMFHRTWRWRQLVSYHTTYISHFGWFVTCYMKLLFTSYGRHSLTLLFKLLLKKPFRLDLAYMLIVKGYHYHMLVKDLVANKNADT